MNLAMAATYDPDPRAPNGFRVPFDLETGELLPQRWRRWLRHDPVNLVARYARNLRTLRGIYHRLRLARPVSHALRQPRCCRSGSPSTACRTSTRSSTARTPASTTAWTAACRFSTAPCAEPGLGASQPPRRCTYGHHALATVRLGLATLTTERSSSSRDGLPSGTSSCRSLHA